MQISLGCMDYCDGLLTKDQQQDLGDLVVIKNSKFFAGSDEYLQLYGVDGALRRFRQSRTGKEVDYIRNQPRQFLESRLESRLGGKILKSNIINFSKINLQKIS